MNEEWYNDQIQLAENRNWVRPFILIRSCPHCCISQRPNYDTWLNQIVASYQTLLDGKDRTFSRFLLDLPTVPGDVLGLLRDLCVDSTRYLVSLISVIFVSHLKSPDRMQVGFTTLRGLVIQRPSMRTSALNVLLELTTHPGLWNCSVDGLDLNFGV